MRTAQKKPVGASAGGTPSPAAAASGPVGVAGGAIPAEDPATTAAAAPSSSSTPEVPPTLTLSSGLVLPPRPALAGFFEDLSYRDYDKDPALRHSTVNKLTDSTPAEFLAALAEDVESTALTVGRVFHTITLEREIAAQTVHVVDAATRNTNRYKEAVAAHPDKDVILKWEFDDLCRMRDSFRSKAINREHLDGAYVESSIFWDDPVTGLACKARPDILAKGLIADLKSTRDFRAFVDDAEKYGYFRQAAWYIDGARAVTGHTYETFRFLVVEKKAPFDTRIFEVGPRALAKARRQNAANLSLYQRCLLANKWPGHPELVEELAP